MMILFLIIFDLLSFLPDEGENKILGWINYGQELTLLQRNDKCGEWGGDIEKLIIYRKGSEGKFAARFDRIVIDCSDTYGLTNQPKIIEGTEVFLSTEEQKLVNQSVEELRSIKMTFDANNFPAPAHAGIVNLVLLSDSSLLIRHYPSHDWKSFEALKKKISQK